jgi:hypothetical protein
MKKKISKKDLIELMWSAWKVTDQGKAMDMDEHPWVEKSRKDVEPKHREILEKYLNAR